MSQLDNERVILYDDKNGFSIKIQSLKRIDEQIKGASLSVKLIRNGEVVTGNLYYEWFSDYTVAEGLFEMLLTLIEDNLEEFQGDKWNFNYHPIRFLIKHRN